MTSPAADGSLGAWLRRLPTYLYLVDLLAGRRVLEVGCGTGFGAQFLANHGAIRVVGVDRSLRNVGDARARYRQTNLEFRCEEPGSIELDDASFDCIFVPDGIDVLRRASVLGELRRLLAHGGHLVLCGPSADRRGSPGGASFYEFRERLERFFPPVRMVAQAPFLGFSLVEYGTGAVDEQSPETHLDTSLLELTGGEPEASEYVAVCGGMPVPARGYTVVQVPEREGMEAVAAAVGMRLEVGAGTGPGLREAGTGPGVAPAGPDEPVWARPATSPGEGGGRDALLVHELRQRLESAIAQAAEARTQVAELRTHAEGQAGQLLALRARVDELHTIEGELRQRLTEAAELAESRQPAGPSPSEQIAEALAAHRDAVRSLEIAVEEGEAYAEELRAELEATAAQVESERLARGRTEERAERALAELRDWRSRASTAEGKLLRLSQADGGDGSTAHAAVAEATPSAPPNGAESARLVELEAELARVRRGWHETETRLEALRAEVAERHERRDGNGEVAAPAPATSAAAARAATATIGRDVSRKLARLELEVESGRSLVHEVESGLAELERQIAREAAERAPSAWAAHRDQQLRELSAELGTKDAEIMILHIGVSALRARIRDLVKDVRSAARLLRDRPLAESIQAMEQLSERVAAFEEREEPTGS